MLSYPQGKLLGITRTDVYYNPVYSRNKTISEAHFLLQSFSPLWLEPHQLDLFGSWKGKASCCLQAFTLAILGAFFYAKPGSASNLLCLLKVFYLFRDAFLNCPITKHHPQRQISWAAIVFYPWHDIKIYVPYLFIFLI